MSRKDSWLVHEDDFLANTVLTHIEQGKTQLEAFEAVSVALNRSAAGVGFRWNGFVRKEYEVEIKAAKAKRLENKSKTKPSITPTRSDLSIESIDETIEILMRLDNEHRILCNKLSDALLRKEELDLELRKLKAHTPNVKPYDYVTEDAEALKMIIQKASELLATQSKKPAI